MSIKTVRVCDCCGKQLGYNSEAYHIDHIDFRTGNFLDAAGSRDYNFERIELCENCVQRAVAALEKIAEMETK